MKNVFEAVQCKAKIFWEPELSVLSDGDQNIFNAAMATQIVFRTSGGFCW